MSIQKINIKEALANFKLKRLRRKIILKERFQNDAKPYLLTQNQIYKEKKEIKTEKKKIKFPSWSKLFLIFLFINFTVLELFTGYVTIQSLLIANLTGLMPDFTPLITLIGAVIGETLSYGIYCLKAKAENTEGGVVHDIAIHNLTNNIDSDDNSMG